MFAMEYKLESLHLYSVPTDSSTAQALSWTSFMLRFNVTLCSSHVNVRDVRDALYLYAVERMSI
jgi:hypothetical protein